MDYISYDATSEGINKYMYRKFKIMYSWVRNVLIMSNMVYCLSDETSEGLNESV